MVTQIALIIAVSVFRLTIAAAATAAASAVDLVCMLFLLFKTIFI